MCIAVVGVSWWGCAGAFGGLTGLLGVDGVGVGVLVGDPGEQVGLAGQQRGVVGRVAAAAGCAVLGELAEELGDLTGGDPRGRVGWRGTGVGISGHGGLRGRGRWRRPGGRAG
jgi:hypothetical protein